MKLKSSKELNSGYHNASKKTDDQNQMRLLPLKMMNDEKFYTECQ